MDPKRKKSGIVVIGTGWWASTNHIPLICESSSAELVGICDIDKDTLAKVKNTFDAPLALSDYRELIRETAPDGVVVSSAHPLHYEHAAAALEAGAHVLVEKPFTTSASEAKDLVRLAADKKLEIVIPYGWNFSSPATAARTHINGGALGKLRHATLHMATATEDLFSGHGLKGTEDALVQIKDSTWADPNKAGGYGWGQLSHGLGLLFMAIDDQPDEVFSCMGLSPTGADLFNAASIKFKSGATAAISGAAGLARHGKSQLDVRVFGDKGHLSIDMERERVRVDSLDGALASEQCFEDGSGNYQCKDPVTYFMDVCAGNSGENPAGGIIGQRAVEVLDAMYNSARTGQPVKV